MPVDKLKETFQIELQELRKEGRLKPPERVIVGYASPGDGLGPRFLLEDEEDKRFLRLNSNNYLGLAQDRRLIEAERAASERLGVNPGGVRFIDGTTVYHRDLELDLADFHGTEAAKIFSCAYMANLGVALALMNRQTYVISDQLNHNSIARAIRIAGVPSENKGIYLHNDVGQLREALETGHDLLSRAMIMIDQVFHMGKDESALPDLVNIALDIAGVPSEQHGIYQHGNMRGLEERLETMPPEIERVIIIFDGVFSMRGNYAPLAEIVAAAKEYNERFKDGVITIMDDSHGTAAYGETGRGTPEVTQENGVDIITSTLGKAFGAEGGYVAGCEEIIEIVRQKADTYIFTNPISPGQANAGIAAVNIINSQEGKRMLARSRENTQNFREGIQNIGFGTIPGIHPIIPVLIRDTAEVKRIVNELYKRGILVTGLVSPVVPEGDETIRVQISAAHTREDLNYALDAFEEVKR